MKITTAFAEQEDIPVAYTCMGANISPPLTIDDVPAGSRTLVLVLEDADASPVPWIHWLVFNMPATTRGVEEGHTPAGGIEGLANNHSFGYEGPCPKYFRGIHHYRLRLFAVDILLDLPAASAWESVEGAMEGHILGQTEVTGLCSSA